MKKRNKLPGWQALFQHQREISHQNLALLQQSDPERFTRYSLSCAGILLDYSRQFLNDNTINLLINLAQDSKLSIKIKELLDGALVNRSEQRPALHMRLRSKDIAGDAGNTEHCLSVRAANQALEALVEGVLNHSHLGISGKPFKHIINIGIGGSHLGPLLTTEALKDFSTSQLQFHFISSVDKAQLNDVWDEINPETSLFIISSKSFSTIETLTNANTILQRMKDKLGDDCIKHHFVAITSAKEKAEKLGIPAELIFPLWEWIGGRYSIWSAIGLPLRLMIGNQQFNEFLAGANEMDEHFLQADFKHNMPVILALISIWYRNFFNTHAEAIIPYAYRLRSLIPYLQQATMESNGKSVDSEGKPLSIKTSPIIFGEEGCNGQHTYHQLLHQGTELIPVDFIIVANTADQLDEHQFVLLASALSQSQALMQGKTQLEAEQALKARAQQDTHFVAAHQAIPGNRPGNLLFIESITPRTLGALIALYEHKIFVQSAIWNINAFDQWGVELGKSLLPGIIKTLQAEQGSDIGFINYLKEVISKND